MKTIFYALRGLYRFQVRRYVRWKHAVVREGMIGRAWWSPYS